MEYRLEKISKEDIPAMLEIFNHYVRTSFAAYPDTELPEEVFARLIASIGTYPSTVIKRADGRIAGFAFLRPYSVIPTFRSTAEITYFIAPDDTGKGAGRLALEYLEKSAAGLGVNNIIAGISGFNTGSMKFHSNNGFRECGRFIGVGRKFGREFDVVWMQKRLAQ